jgi:Domain of unknown function (DUF4157)
VFSWPAYLSIVKTTQVKIKENSWLAKLAAAKLKEKKVAIVFGNTIHLHNTTAQEFLQDKKWVKHELKHVEQYKRHGFAGFIGRYLVESVKKGYHNNKFEKEARECECEEELKETEISFYIK